MAEGKDLLNRGVAGALREEALGTIGAHLDPPGEFEHALADLAGLGIAVAFDPVAVGAPTHPRSTE